MKNVFNFVICLFTILLFAGAVFADDKHDAIRFFHKYVNAANSYSSEITKMYSPNAKIIRQVIKPDGELVDVETDVDTYIKQLKLSQSVAKLKKYKNSYTNVTSAEVPGGYKISSLRQPSGEDYRLKTYVIVKKQPNGKWLITEEMMQTKVQTFLQYAKN